MSRSPYGAFNQTDLPPGPTKPGSSTFEAIMPVDERIEGVNHLVHTAIPLDLAAGFARNDAGHETLTTFEHTPALSIVRKMGLRYALDPAQEKKDFDRREFVLAALGQGGVTCAKVHAELVRGKLIDYSVAGELSGTNDWWELVGLVNQEDQTNEYYFRERPHNKPSVDLPINEDIALDFLAGICERQSGNRAPESEQAMLNELFNASPYRERKQSGRYVIECSNGIQSFIEADRRTIMRGEKIIGLYALTTTNELPTGDKLSLAVKLEQEWRKKRKRTEPSANIKMHITDKAGTSLSPMERAAEFSKLFNYYREDPEEFYSILARAAECLATTETIAEPES